MKPRLSPAPRMVFAALAVLAAAVAALLAPPAHPGPRDSLIPPLEVQILDAKEKERGTALVYPNFIELQDREGGLRGAIGVVMVQGKVQLFLIQAGEERRLIGWAENYRLYNTEDKLVGYYYWTPIWSYVYDPKMKKVGQAQCLAYQGVCAAGIAGFLLGLI